MKELKDLQVGDPVALIRYDMLLKDDSINKAVAIKVGKRQIKIETSDKHSYNYLVRNGRVPGSLPYARTNRIEPWENEKHQLKWEKCQVTIKTIRAKGNLLEKITKLEDQLNTFDKQVERLLLIQDIRRYIDKRLEDKQ